MEPDATAHLDHVFVRKLVRAFVRTTRRLAVLRREVTRFLAPASRRGSERLLVRRPMDFSAVPLDRPRIFVGMWVQFVNARTIRTCKVVAIARRDRPDKLTWLASM
jgi:hypothetical protein